MDILNLLNEFTSDNLVSEKASRRDSFKTLGSLGKKAAAAAIPFGLATMMPKKSFAQMGGGDPISALQLALTLEYLEAAFYNMGTMSGGIIEQMGDSRSMTVYNTIADHENSHVAFLQTGLGDDSVESPEFDFTAGGLFDPFNEDSGISAADSYAQFLAISQALEDTGVRAYKGQAGNLMGTDFLTPALQIHSVEARHASEVRRIRGLKGWITLDERGAGMPSQTQPVYDGEENLMQLGVDNAQFAPSGANAAEAASEAYDEFITGDQAEAIASLFIVG